MRVCIHRGSKQIGGSCVEIESCGQRLLIDFGLPLDAEENSRKYLPQTAGLDGSDPSLLGVLISHSHLDHFGLLAHISPKIPVGMGDDQTFSKESDIEAQLVQVFSATEGLALVHTSAQNIDRIVSIMRASKRTGRKLVIDLYAAAILEATGNQNIPQSDWPEVALFVPQAQRIQIKKNAWFDLLKRHAANRIYIENLQEAPKKSTLLFRPLHRFDLERGKCLTGAVYIYSQWDGYWEQDSYDYIKEWLERNEIPKYSIHTSGHASPVDLKKLVATINPRKVVPIHSFMPERYPELFPNVEAHDDGEWWEV